MDDEPQNVEALRVKDICTLATLDDHIMFTWERTREPVVENEPIDFEDDFQSDSSTSFIDNLFEGIYTMIPFKKYLGLEKQFQLTKEFAKEDPNLSAKVTGMMLMSSIYVYVATGVTLVYTMSTK